MSEVDDMEKSALLSRCREILHQGYKFGFEVNSVICMVLFILTKCRRWMLDISKYHDWGLSC